MNAASPDCASAVTPINAINKIIIGVQKKYQLSEILSSNTQNFQHSIPRELEIDDPMLINPQNWKL